MRAPLGIGETLDWSLRVYRAAFLPVLGLSVLFAAPYTAALRYFAAHRTGKGLGPQLLGAFGLPVTGAPSDGSLPGVAWATFGLAILIMLLYGALIRTVDQVWRGETPTVGRALVWSLRRLFATAVTGVMALVAGLLMTFASLFVVTAGIGAAMAGTARTLSMAPQLVQVVAGILIICVVVLVGQTAWLSFLFVPQVIVVESRGYFRAIGRSLGLVWRHFFRSSGLFWAAAGLWFSLSLLVYLPQLLWERAVGAAGLTLVTALFQALITTLTFPLLALITTVAYYDLRLRSEGFDLAERLRQLEEGNGHG